MVDCPVRCNFGSCLICKICFRSHILPFLAFLRNILLIGGFRFTCLFIGLCGVPSFPPCALSALSPYLASRALWHSKGICCRLAWGRNTRLCNGTTNVRMAAQHRAI